MLSELRRNKLTTNYDLHHVVITLCFSIRDRNCRWLRNTSHFCENKMALTNTSPALYGELRYESFFLSVHMGKSQWNWKQGIYEMLWEKWELSMKLKRFLGISPDHTLIIARVNISLTHNGYVWHNDYKKFCNKSSL